MMLLLSMCFADDYREKDTNHIANSNKIESQDVDEPPEGYYAFIESPNADPPKVKMPPYNDSDKECQG